MDPGVWTKAMYSTSCFCLDGCTADPTPLNSDVSAGDSVVLHKDREQNAYNTNDDTGSGLIHFNPSRDHTSGPVQTRRPASSSYGHHELRVNSGHQAKRARVENIIKGMASSSGSYCPDVMKQQHKEPGSMQEIERSHDEELMERSGSGCQTARLHESQHQHLRQLRTKFNHMDEKYPTSHYSPEEESPTDTCPDSYSRKYQGWKKMKLRNYYQSKPERIKLIADVLKYELSRAVSRSVDSIFKSMPLLETKAEGNAESDAPLQSSLCNNGNLTLSCCGNAEVHVPDVQTEALSLVVQKTHQETANKFMIESTSTPLLHPRPAVHFQRDAALREDLPSGKNPSVGHHHGFRCLQDEYSNVGLAKFEAFDTHWNSVKARSKVNSRSVRSSHTHTAPMDRTLLESPHLPHVKIETDCVVKNNLYMLNEGLTTNHLKKAKLMFFYTRYPSSLVLKLCFHDVQFSRCITSQLIKWFSNFREFYYIQMEKFARHALMEGPADPRGLTVGRESELFRALNLHYNKANDFQVPDRFLEVTEITLREFYVAISTGKDRDPSWKKAIYKVICKLDSDVPAEFKGQRPG